MPHITKNTLDTAIRRCTISHMAELDFRRLSQRQAAKVLGISVPTVKSWIDRGMPTNEGKIDTKLVLDWKVAIAKKEAQEAYGDSDMRGGDGMDGESLERYRKARAEMVEFDLKVKRKLYLEIDEVRAKFRKAASAVSVGMLAVGKKLSIKLSKEAHPTKCQELVDDEVNKVLSDLSKTKFSDHDDVIDEMIDERESNSGVNAADHEAIDLVES